MSSIARRLTLGVGIACLVLWSGASIVLYLVLRDGLVAEFDQALEASALAIAPLTEHTEGRIKFDATGEMLPSFERPERPDYFQVLLSDGSTLARSVSLGTGTLFSSGGTLPALGTSNVALPDGQAGRAIAIRFVPTLDEDEPPESSKRDLDDAASGRNGSGGAAEDDAGEDSDAPGSGSQPSDAGASPRRADPPQDQQVILIVARHRADLDRRLASLAMTLLLVGLSTVGLAALTVGVVVRRGLKPLARLAERASAIDASSLQLRFPTDAMPAELEPIARRLNDLLERLEASFGRERRFSADVAHELRTPIAELRSLAEVSLRWPDDREAVTRAMNDALAIAIQMEAIATDLLALARCEAGFLTVRSEPVLLTVLVADVWRPLAARASDKNLDVRMSVPDGAIWTTDLVAFRAILRNLLANAVEHAPVNGAIRLTVATTNGQGRLEVSNTASDFTPDDLPHLFDRFWRKDSARTSTNGCGLGLALTKGYADALGMRLRAHLPKPGELAIELTVPLS